MFEIDTPGATGDKKFTEGDSVLAVPATEVSADWLNMLQAELKAVLVAAAIAPLKANNTQLLAALQSLIATDIASLVDSSPATLDTLNELAAALGDDPDFATTMINALATKETPAGAQAKVDALLEATTRMVFVQAAAPTGWTKVTGMEGRGIRLVDGAGGGIAGNSDAFGAHVHSVGEHAHGHSLSVASHTLTVSEMPVHSHTVASMVEATGPAGGGYLAGFDSSPVTATTSNAGGGAGHGHAISGSVSNSAAFNTSSFVPKYVNSIVCSKD